MYNSEIQTIGLSLLGGTVEWFSLRGSGYNCHMRTMYADILAREKGFLWEFSLYVDIATC